LAELEIVKLDRIEKRARKCPAEEMVDAGQSAKWNAEMRSWHGVPTSSIITTKARGFMAKAEREKPKQPAARKKKPTKKVIFTETEGIKPEDVPGLKKRR
jgi:hypothetical protein